MNNEIKPIMDLLDSAIYRSDRHKLLSDVFELGAIAVSNRFDTAQSPQREEIYRQIIGQYRKPEQDLIIKIFSEIYCLLTSCVSKCGEFNDWLGDIYMQSETSSSKAGQFFTPYNVSKLTAAMSIDQNIVREKAESGEILSIAEPACGSGGMILAALDVLWNQYHFNYATQCFVETADIDPRCVHMCYLQLSLVGVPAIVKHQDTLTLQTWDVWYTPAYLMQWLKFKKFERGGIDERNN